MSVDSNLTFSFSCVERTCVCFIVAMMLAMMLVVMLVLTRVCPTPRGTLTWLLGRSPV